MGASEVHALALRSVDHASALGLQERAAALAASVQVFQFGDEASTGPAAADAVALRRAAQAARAESAAI